MELHKEILAKVLEGEEINIIFPNLKINAADIVEMECYKALQKIKAIIENDSFDDAECFLKIEKIINLLESLGSNGGSRHDFG